METSTVANATGTESGPPATFRGVTSRPGTAAPSRRRGAVTTPEHLIRITEAAAVAAVEAFYRPGSVSRTRSAASQASQVAR